MNLNMNPVKLVIFDMDGLLFDTERPSYAAMKEIMERKGYHFSLDNYKQIIGLSDKECNSVMQKTYGEDFRLELISTEYRNRFKEILDNDGLVIKDGAEFLLKALDKKRIKKCIASSSSKETIQLYLERAGLEKYFDFYRSGEEVENGKPHPDIFLEACKRANESPETSIVLEDSLNGLRAAFDAKIRCIIVPDLIKPNEEMKNKAFSILSNLEQVVPLLEE